MTLSPKSNIQRFLVEALLAADGRAVDDLELMKACGVATMGALKTHVCHAGKTYDIGRVRGVGYYCRGLRTTQKQGYRPNNVFDDEDYVDIRDWRPNHDGTDPLLDALRLHHPEYDNVGSADSHDAGLVPEHCDEDLVATRLPEPEAIRGEVRPERESGVLSPATKPHVYRKQGNYHRTVSLRPRRRELTKSELMAELRAAVENTK